MNMAKVMNMQQQQQQQQSMSAAAVMTQKLAMGGISFNLDTIPLFSALWYI